LLLGGDAIVAERDTRSVGVASRSAPGLVEGVDQGVEPLGGVAPGRGETRDVLQEHGVEAARDGQVVLRPQRVLAQAGEADAQQAAAGEG
jgi:hypothetical protein